MSDKVHLMDLRLRTSAAGNRYLAGWLGKASVVAFLDREAEGEVWNVFLSTPAPRSDAGSRPAEKSPFTPRQRKPRGAPQPLKAGELDDPLPDFGKDR